MKIYELLDSPEKWTKGYFARNKTGDPTESHDNDACCWCLIGAAMKCYNNIGSTTIIDLLNEKAYLLGYGHAVHFNDDSDYKTIIEFVKELNV